MLVDTQPHQHSFIHLLPLSSSLTLPIVESVGKLLSSDQFHNSHHKQSVFSICIRMCLCVCVCVHVHWKASVLQNGYKCVCFYECEQTNWKHKKKFILLFFLSLFCTCYWCRFFFHCLMLHGIVNDILFLLLLLHHFLLFSHHLLRFPVPSSKNILSLSFWRRKKKKTKEKKKGGSERERENNIQNP